MPDCGVHCLWFALVCFLIRSSPPPLPRILSPGGRNKPGLAGWPKGEIIGGGRGIYLALLLCTRDWAKNIVPGVPQID